MKINYNVSAMLANNALANNDSLLAKSLERLSSGLKINHAKDNPAGLAMGNRMNAQLEGLSKANRNASDGVSVIETADGAMTEISEMLQRLNELAIKSANGLESDSDRSVIQDEVVQLTQEITRVAESTEFNGQRLLNGEFSLKGYTNQTDIKVSSYSTSVTEKIYTISSLEIGFDSLTGEYTAKVDPKELEEGGFPVGTSVSVKDRLLTFQGPNGFDMKLDLTEWEQLPKVDENTSCTIKDLEVDATGIGAMRLQIGANEGQVLAMDIPRISLRDMGLESAYSVFDEEADKWVLAESDNGEGAWTLDISTKDAATDAIDRIDNAIQYVSSVRGRLGAYQNRLESTINSLDVTTESMTAAYSRIMDVDMAEEMTQYTSMQVMTQAGTSVLAQANERPASVLQLLQ